MTRVSKAERDSMKQLGDAITLGKQRELMREKMKNNHKCTGCVWGNWHGDTMYCMFSTCFRDKERVKANEKQRR